MRHSKCDYLRVWLPTGSYIINAFRATWRGLSHPAFLIIIAVVSAAAILYFNLTNGSRLWVLPIVSTVLAIVGIMCRLKMRGRMIISERQAQKCNILLYRLDFFGNCYARHIDNESKRTKDDRATNTALYRNLGEALIALGLYDETGQTKAKLLSGMELELVTPIEFYTDIILSAGVGYVMIVPSITLISKVKSVDERVISRTLREIGLINWTVERINYDDDLVFFVLKDETASRAYDFSGE